MIKRTRGLGAAWMGPHSMGHGAVCRAAASSSKPGCRTHTRSQTLGKPQVTVPTHNKAAGWSAVTTTTEANHYRHRGMRSTNTLDTYIAFCGRRCAISFVFTIN